MSKSHPEAVAPVAKKVKQPADGALVVAALSLVVAFAIVIAGGVYSLGLIGGGAINEGGLVASLALLVVLLAVLPVVVLLQAMRRPMRSVRAMVERRFDDLLREMSHVRQESALSDDARRVLNRSREREVLCRAIEEDIESGDWDAGIVLSKELAERFGYRVEAEEFRAKIERARSDTMRGQVDAAISLLDGLIVQRRWEAAMLEAGRIERLYPDAPRARGLRERVEKARRHYREDLERRFLQASRDDRIDEAMSLLRELDGYLTHAEAEPYMEVARGVIGKARQNLGAQFKLAVQDRRWVDATFYGGKILAEFPNSRMASEVRPVIDEIRERAARMPAQVGEG